MVKVSIQVTGVEQFASKMAALLPAIQTTVQVAMKEEAQATVQTMKQFCPVGSDGDPELRETIGFAWGEGGPHGEDDLQLKFYVGSRATPYARYVEWGTVNTPAQPFFYPALRVHRAEMLGGMKTAAFRAVRGVAGRGN